MKKYLLLILAILYTGNYYCQSDKYYEYKTADSLTKSYFAKDRKLYRIPISEKDSSFLVQSIVITNTNGMKEKHVYGYDDRNNLIDDTFYKLSDSGWVCSKKFTFIFDADNNLQAKSNYIWADFRWYQTSLVLFAYDKNGNTIFNFKKDWSDNYRINNPHGGYQIKRKYDLNNNLIFESNTFKSPIYGIRFLRTFYTYDSHGNKISKTGKSKFKNKWLGTRQDIFSYDNKGNKISEINQIYKNNKWIGKFEKKYKYDENGDEIFYCAKKSIENGWQKVLENTKMYNLSRKIIENTRKSFTKKKLREYRKRTVKYDSLGMKIFDLTEWSSSDSGKSMYTYTYDSDDRMQSRSYLKWMNNSWSKVNCMEYKYNSIGEKTKEIIHVWRNESLITRHTNTFERKISNKDSIYQESREREEGISISTEKFFFNSEGSTISYILSKKFNDYVSTYEERKILRDINDNISSFNFLVPNGRYLIKSVGGYTSPTVSLLDSFGRVFSFGPVTKLEIIYIDKN